MLTAVVGVGLFDAIGGAGASGEDFEVAGVLEIEGAGCRVASHQASRNELELVHGNWYNVLWDAFSCTGCFCVENCQDVPCYM